MAEQWTREQFTEYVERQYEDQASEVMRLVNQWLARGDGAAVYENQDLGHPQLGSAPDYLVRVARRSTRNRRSAPAATGYRQSNQLAVSAYRHVSREGRVKMADVNDLEVVLTVKVRMPRGEAHRLATMQSGFTPDDYRSHAAEIIADSVTRGILGADAIKSTSSTVEINREASL